MVAENIHSSSFRDPSGFIFSKDDEIYRQVNKIYEENYDYLISSGLYENLVSEKLLVSHEEVHLDNAISKNAYKVIKPELIPFISYPYEWGFNQLKDAALTTLKIQKKALEAGMTLKDCSAYNIQFKEGKPIFIDTLSFEKYKTGEPWIAYKQFCQHFLAPLALMSYKDIRLNKLLRIYIDGIPLDLASSLLPLKTKVSFSLISHIHMQAKAQKYFSNKTVDVKKHHKLSYTSLQAIIDNLESAVNKLYWNPKGTEWGDYYENTNYSTDAFNHKNYLVSEFLDKIKPNSVWDLGANDGSFSRIASKKGIQTISFDVDPVAVEKNYLRCKRECETKILPLLLDLTNPSPAIGWAHSERMSISDRSPAEMVFALALIHHLAISNNLPLFKIAKYFQSISNSLIIEFVPKSDSQVQKLLATREDIFPDYNLQKFEEEFGKFFTIKNCEKISNSDRVLYLMTAKF